jgi:hypothetical protein
MMVKNKNTHKSCNNLYMAFILGPHVAFSLAPCVPSLDFGGQKMKIGR